MLLGEELASAALILASIVDIRESKEADTAVCTDWPTSCCSAATGEEDVAGEVEVAVGVEAIGLGGVLEVGVDAIANAGPSKTIKERRIKAVKFHSW